MTETFYDLLGIPADAEAPEIERAYRNRIKETHPDLNDAPDASEQTARLVNARDVLTDESERARYDRLGHDAYVGGQFSAATDPGSRASPDPTPYGGAQAAAEAAKDDTDDGPTNARAGAEERRRRERRARRDVNFGDEDASSTASGSTTEQTTGSATDAKEPNANTSNANTAKTNSANANTTNTNTTNTNTTNANATDVGPATDASGGTTTGRTGSHGRTATNGGSAAGAAVGTGGERRRTTAHPEPPSWSDTSQGWAARTPTSPTPGLFDLVRNALQEAPGTAVISFVLYPLLVLGAFFPPFPLLVNVIVAMCLLAMIAAAQSVPGLGVAIYGGWTILGTLGLILVGVDPLAPLGIVVLGTSWLPLGFSILTSRVLDP